MKKAGGIVALIAGIFGTLAALFTIFFGGISTAFEVEGSQLIVALGWGGLFFSFLTIVLAAVAMNSKSKTPGIFLIISAIAGAVLGGTFVAICMALALIGGVLALFGKEKKQTAS